MYFLSGVKVNSKLSFKKSEDFLLKLRCIDYFKYIYNYYNTYISKDFFVEEQGKGKKVPHQKISFFDFNISFVKIFLLFLSKKYSATKGQVNYSIYKFLFLLCKNLVSLFYFISLKSIGVHNNQFKLDFSHKYSFDLLFFLGLNDKFFSLSSSKDSHLDEWFTLFLKLGNSSGGKSISGVFKFKDSNFKYKKYLKYLLNASVPATFSNNTVKKAIKLDFFVTNTSFSKWVYYYYYYLRLKNYSPHYFYLFFIYLLLVNNRVNKSTFSSTNKDLVVASYLVIKYLLLNSTISTNKSTLIDKKNYLLSIKNAYRYFVEVSLGDSIVESLIDTTKKTILGKKNPFFGFTLHRKNNWLSKSGEIASLVTSVSSGFRKYISFSSNYKSILLDRDSSLFIGSSSKSSFLLGLYYKLRFTNKFKSILKSSNSVANKYYYYKEYSIVLLYRNIRYTNKIFSSITDFYNSYWKNINLYYAVLNYFFSVGYSVNIDLNRKKSFFFSSVSSVDILFIIRLYLNYFRFSSFILSYSNSLGITGGVDFNYLTFLYNKLFYYWCYKNSFILNRLKYNFLFSLYYNKLNSVVIKLDTKSIYYNYLLYIYNDNLAINKKKVFRLKDTSRAVFNSTTTEFSYIDSHNYKKENTINSLLKLNTIKFKHKVSFLFKSRLVSLFSNILLKDGKKAKFESIFYKLLSGLYVGTYGKNPLVLFIKLITILNNVFKLKSISAFNQNSFIIKLYNTENQFKDSFRQLVAFLNGDSTYFTSFSGNKLISYLFSDGNSLNYVRTLNGKSFNVEQKLLLLLLTVLLNNSSIYKEKIKLNKKTYQSLKNNSFFLTYGSNLRSRSNINSFLSSKFNKFNPTVHSSELISLLLNRYQNDLYLKKLKSTKFSTVNTNIVVFSALLKKLFNYFMFDQYKGSLVNGVVNAEVGYGFYLDRIPVKDDKDVPLEDVAAAKKFKEEFEKEDLLDKNYNSVDELVSTVMDLTLSGKEKSKVVNYISLLYCLILKYIYYVNARKSSLGSSYLDFILEYLNVIIVTLNDSGILFNYKGDTALSGVLPSYLSTSSIKDNDELNKKSKFLNLKLTTAGYKVNPRLITYYLDSKRVFQFSKSFLGVDSRVVGGKGINIFSNSLYSKYLSINYNKYINLNRLDLLLGNRLEVESNHC